MKRSLAFAILALALAAPVLAQGSGPIRIESVDYESAGLTRPFILEMTADIEIGREFAGRAELDAYLAEAKQTLINQRQLASVELEVQIDESTSPAEAAVIVRTSDTWNIIVLPYPKYDSNSGLTLSLKGRDYNFLGTLQRLVMDLIYRDDLEGERSFEIYSKVTVPFRATGYIWNATIEQSLSWELDGGAGTAYSGSFGIGPTISLGESSLSFGLSQGLSLNELNEDGSRFDDFWYLSNTASAGLSVPLVKETSWYGRPSWNLNLGATQKYRPFGEIGDERRGTLLNTGTGFSTGKVDWIGNFRQGVSASISTPWSYDFFTEDWKGTLDFVATGFKPLGPFGPSARLHAFHVLAGGANEEAGGDLRGILNSRVDAESAVFLNVDLPLRLFTLKPGEITGIKGLRVLDFELQTSPFMDFGYADLSGAWMSAGLEVLVFPRVTRSLIGRVSFGVDVPAVLENRSIGALTPEDAAKAYEIFIGIDTHY